MLGEFSLCLCVVTVLGGDSRRASGLASRSGVLLTVQAGGWGNGPTETRKLSDKAKLKAKLFCVLQSSVGMAKGGSST